MGRQKQTETFNPKIRITQHVAQATPRSSYKHKLRTVRSRSGPPVTWGREGGSFPVVFFLFWREFPFFSEEFAKIPPILGSLSPPVYLLATKIGEICLNLSGDTRQCCYRTGTCLTDLGGNGDFRAARGKLNDKYRPGVVPLQLSVTARCVHGWMDGWVDEWMRERMLIIHLSLPVMLFYNLV
jgi:hypothetical protein